MAAKSVITGTAVGVLVMLATGCNPTNVAARVGANVVGAMAVVKHLLDRSATGLVATHDVAL